MPELITYRLVERKAKLDGFDSSGFPEIDRINFVPEIQVPYKKGTKVKVVITVVDEVL